MDQNLIIKEIEECLGYKKGHNIQFLGYDFSENGELRGIEMEGIEVPDPVAFISLLKSFDSLRKLRVDAFCEMKDLSLFTELQQLHSLTITATLFDDMEALTEMINLRELNISFNNVSRIPVFTKLKNLRTLILSCNTNLKDISALGCLPFLNKLHLSSNKINDIDVLANLLNISALHLHVNNIEDITPLQELKQLRELSLSHNPISNFSVLDNLTNLEILEVAGCNLTDISFMRNMVNLKNVNIDSNQISDISCLRNMHSLEELHCIENQIADISCLKECTKMKHLFSFDNKIEDIRVLSNWKDLQFIGLSSNRIKDVSPLAELVSVKSIHLNNNRIKDISPLKNVLSMACSDFKNNKISSLPEWIADIKTEIFVNDEYISFYWEDEDIYLALPDNPLSDPPVEIVQQGANAIRRYFERKKKEKFSSIREAKLILVGDGASGKTSLGVRLLDSKADLPAEDKRTRGIQVRDWEFKKGFVAHIWDFGGQDVYYPVHRFFMTENAVFVLLASTRDEKHNFDYWIPTIFQFGGSSPVIIGQTCHDGNTVPWNDLGMYISKPGLNIIKTSMQPYYELNLPKRNRGLADIRKVIMQQLSQLPHCRKNVPVSWVRVRDLLKELSKKEPCITYDRFTEICAGEFPDDNQSAEGFADCCTFLHHTGTLFWYSANNLLRGYVILDPDWSVWAVYKMIDDEKIQKRKGHIVESDFGRLWKERYYHNRYEILKQMLNVFRVAFPKKHKPEEFIIPARLVSIPDVKHWSPEGCVKLHYDYKTFMPRGILNQLSAELSRYIVTDNDGNEEVWNNAVNFTSEDGDCQVYEDFYSKQIVLLARGFEPRGNMRLIMNVLNDIHDQYKEVNPEIIVPCRCNSCNRGEHVTLFKYSDLMRWYKEREPQATAFCNESGTVIPIRHLLKEVGLNITANEVEISHKESSKTLRIFLASSYELEEERKQFEQFTGRKNKALRDKNMFLHLDIWEDLPSHMSQTCSQDEYNKKVRECDIFICLCYSWMGKYTEEEFDLAVDTFNSTNKPRIYVFLKEPPFPAGINSSQLKSREIFQDKLQQLGYFPIKYKAPADFINHITRQLEEIIG